MGLGQGDNCGRAGMGVLRQHRKWELRWQNFKGKLEKRSAKTVDR